jgi:hypothetical protein
MMSAVWFVFLNQHSLRHFEGKTGAVADEAAAKAPFLNACEVS